MSDNTGIEWTDATWNPITGCTKISEGCRHCYAQRMAARMAGRNGYPKVNPFTPGVEHPAQWTKPMSWRKPRKIFVCSMGDLFHEAVTVEQIQKVLDFCRQSTQHTFQILTKRPERCGAYDFPPNVWLGTTVESHTEYHRIDALAECAVSVRFLSCEPLISPLATLKNYLKHTGWVIVGAETGPNARPMDLDWARQIRDDCAAAEIPFFFKRDSQGNSTLDGVEYHQFPEVAHAYNFTCPNCQADISERAHRVLGETSQHYMPYDLRVLCPACGALVTFDLDWRITLAGAKAKKGGEHAH